MCATPQTGLSFALLPYITNTLGLLQPVPLVLHRAGPKGAPWALYDAHGVILEQNDLWAWRKLRREADDDPKTQKSMMIGVRIAVWLFDRVRQM